MHKLQLHKVLLEIGHGVTQFGKAILEAFEGISRRRSSAPTL
jgi:hypothetical protein